MIFTHLHIPKTAGTSLRESLKTAHPDLNIFQLQDPLPRRLGPDVDIASGHCSYTEAAAFGAPIVTVLRHPIDRFVSIYYFWKELYNKGIETTRKTTLADRLSLSDFARAMDEPELASELYNRAAWQLHSNFRLLKRFEARQDNQLTNSTLAAGALDNLRSFAVVGFQDRYDVFLDALNARFGLTIENRRINVTSQRSAISDLSHDELRAILAWVEADMEVYATAEAEFG